MKKALPSLSVLCLAYNEEENVRWAIPLLLSTAEEFTDDYEIVVVASRASRDATNEILEEFHRTNPRIRPVVQPPGTRGYGPAFAFGLTQLQKEFAFHVDIDGQFNFADFARLVAVQQKTEADLVHFNRRHRRDPWERKFYGLGFKLLVHTFYDCPVWDFDSAFNLFRTSPARGMQLASNSGMAVPEFMIRLKQQKARIVSGWTEHQPRRAGKPAWEVPSGGVILPDAGIVRACFADLWRLRGILGTRFSLQAKAAPSRK
jgi:glycosyltransferase involved in cell wall biosynthesis